MIRIITALLMVLLIVNTGQAMAPINEDSLRKAQEFGKLGVNKQLQEFLQPWTFYEEKAPRLDASAELARVYTPWLLVAADAREKTASRRPFDLTTAEIVLSDYAGYLPVNVELYSQDPKLFDGITAVLKQNGKTFPSYQIMPPADSGGASMSSGPCYIYFKMEGLRTDRPVQLIVDGGDGKIRRFYVDLGKIK